ncbi:hypothetical protein SAMN05421819_0893 [Bryocella elongata]|uniref:Mannosylglycerate hydrolase MGH1-like glycoside hydrolase domain-containing protein n=1 Tax=Bryocella elongata TaxID=863522 RepID=A0A1H5U721_9BACT|nr:hypothetical protein [Bryocella elongata]SEF70779.1 hypothetical protein SAMN05421819_0893 [Bryocella elongata]
MSRGTLWILLCLPWTCVGQAPPLHPVDDIAMDVSGPKIVQAVRTGEPFTVAGPHGIIVGEQQGGFESWLLPVKLLSHWTIEANVQGYPVPIELNTMARELEVRPDRTTITYAHIALTVRQIMFAPEETLSGTGAVVLFEVDALKPVDLVFRFTPEMRRMWPALNSGPPDAEWVTQGASGYYLLHTAYPDFTGAVAIPGATPGIMAPYQERPQEHPLEFHLHVEPSAGHKVMYPLLMAVGRSAQAATGAALDATLTTLNDSLSKMYAKHAEVVRERATSLTHLETPDTKLDEAFDWAEASIEQLRATAPDGEQALVAGYYASGDSARPGFGWFFGRDALYTLYAVNGFGDFALTREELEFLMKRQRADGKMMHEYSQTAGELDWSQFPYEYAAADATPLFLMAMADYLRASGDVAFLSKHQDAVRKAWQFETTHDADGDGIYDNSQGTGWVESWPPGMPKQEIYMALLDAQASDAMREIAAALGDQAGAEAAHVRASKVRATLEREYFEPESGNYAFSFNAGSADGTRTVYPALAWWSDEVGLAHPEASLRAFASHDFDTDWGARDIAASDPMFDGMSYHQGSVWPLFTGWGAMAEYRAGHSLAGRQMLMQNVDLTWAQDPGAVTELLSGDFFEPFGRSTSHQLWSSAMVVTPILRGMFGITLDASSHSIMVKPRLPASWMGAAVRSLHLGDSVADIVYRREGTTMVVSVKPVSGPVVRIAGADMRGELRVPLPAVTFELPHGLPLRGARTAQPKVLSEQYSDHRYDVEFEGLAGTEMTLRIVRNDPGVKLSVDGAALDGDTLTVRFPAGGGYVSRKVSLRW